MIKVICSDDNTITTLNLRGGNFAEGDTVSLDELKKIANKAKGVQKQQPLACQNE